MQYSTIPIRTVAYGTTNLMGGGKIQVLLQKYLHRFTNLIKKKFNTVQDLPVFISFLCTRLQKWLIMWPTVMVSLTGHLYSFFSASAGLVRMRRRVWMVTASMVVNRTAAKAAMYMAGELSIRSG